MVPIVVRGIDVRSDTLMSEMNRFRIVRRARSGSRPGRPRQASEGLGVCGKRKKD
jgi:hypothetical protein